MRISKISANQCNISFTNTIKADSYQDAKNKFMLNNSKNNYSFPFICPEIDITNITRRY